MKQTITPKFVRSKGGSRTHRAWLPLRFGMRFEKGPYSPITLFGGFRLFKVDELDQAQWAVVSRFGNVRSPLLMTPAASPE